MSSIAFTNAAEGHGVLISETGVERLQLVARAGASTFLLGGNRTHGGMTSGPNPYEMLSAALGACTAMTLRLFAERNGYPLDKVEVSVTPHRASPGGRDGFERVIVLEGNLDERQRGRLLQAANACPVGMAIGRASDVRTIVSPAGDRAPMSPASSEYMRDLQAVVDAEELELRHAAADLDARD